MRMFLADDPTRITLVQKLHAEGMSDAAIGEAIGFTRSAVEHWRKRNSLPPTHRQGRPTTETRLKGDALVSEIRKMTAEGLSCQAIGERIGYSRTTVSNVQVAHSLRDQTPPSRPVPPFDVDSLETGPCGLAAADGRWWTGRFTAAGFPLLTRFADYARQLSAAAAAKAKARLPLDELNCADLEQGDAL